MRKLKHYLSISLLCLLSVSTATAFHVPPWDTGHNSFQGDPGDGDTDPGDDGPCKSGSPVELASGNFVYVVRDLQIVGLGPAIDLTRTYNSRDMRKGPFGNGWVFAYDQRLVETTDGVRVLAVCSKPNGKREVFTKQADGSYAAPPHSRETLIKNGDNSYTLRSRGGGVQRFNADGRLVSLTDRNGNSLMLAYDPTGFPSSLTDASGRVVRLTKGADGKVESIADPAGRTFRYAYDSAGNLTRFTDALGNATTYQYDSKNNLTAVLDPRNNKLMGVTYDSGGRVATLLEGAETWTYSYLANPRRTTKRDSTNNTWTYFHNDTGNLTRVIDPLGKSETYTYDASFNLTSLTNKNGSKTTYTYDASGNLLTVTDAGGGTRTFTYGQKFNLPLTARDRAGNLTTHEYDAQGNLVKTINPIGQVTEIKYDSKGLPTTIIDPAGRTTSFSYDAHGNLAKTTDPLGNTSTAAFDILGKVLTTTDAEGRTLQHTYDDAERRTRLVNQQGGTVTFEYDASGNLTAVVLPNGARTTFEYDALSRLARATSPTNRVSTYSYDRRNNLISKAAGGQTIQYSYDALDRLVRKTRPDGVVNFGYDAVGNLLTVADSDSTLTFVFDTLNRLQEARTAASAGQPATVIKYTYDSNGNRRTMTDPNGGVTNYSYDALARLTSLTNPAGHTFGFTYDANSRRTQMTRMGGSTSAYSYDAAGRLLTLTHQSGAGGLSFTNTYDRVGTRLSQTDALGSHLYSYDALYQLTGVTHPASGGPVESYAYDPLGNRTGSHLSTSYTHNAASALTADAVFDYAYDPNGNRTTRTHRATSEVTTYTYDSENQLIRVASGSGQPVTYRYDGFGRRIEKSVGGQATRYVYDGQDVLLEYAGATPQARYTHGPQVDEVLSVERQGSTSFFETDPLGSIVRVTDGTNVKAAYVYDSFGRVVGGTGADPSPYLFQGREFDRESGLYYLRARYYDPELGRFVSEDPTGFAGGLNFYMFALNNPANMRDPFGLRPCADDWLDKFQTLLDIAGLVPGIGEIFDLGNAGIYALRGDSLNASLSAGSAIPFVGWAGTGAKLGNKALKGAVNVTSKPRTVERALTTAEKFLGPGYKEIAPGVFRSSDGARQFRMTTNDLTPTHGKIGPHVHFEKFDPVTGEQIKNIHTPLIDP